MTAKEMFEKLGYFYDDKENKIVIFRTWYNGYNEMKHEEICRFVKINNSWTFRHKKEIILKFNHGIDVELFKAINKQVEELGWNK